MAIRAQIIIATCLCLTAGCSSKREITLVPADGTVTYNGKPLAGAQVLFYPVKGPQAVATTDSAGKFVLKTVADRGIVAGEAKVAVTVPIEGNIAGTAGVSLQPKTAAEAQEYLKKAAEIRQSAAAGKTDFQRPSTIPEKYAKPDTSGLSFTIKPTGGNHITIELQP